MIRAYIFQHGKTIAFFDTALRQIDDSVRGEAERLMLDAIYRCDAERGYFDLQLVELNDFFTLDNETLIV